MRFTNDRTLKVASCRFEGDLVVLEMPDGGELRAPRNLIAELLPDEVPLAHAVAIEALAGSRTATATRLAKGTILEMVTRIAQKVELDQVLARAVVQVESNYNELAVSPKGAMGLMQIMPIVAQEYAVSDPFNPEQNLEAGMRHLKALLGRYGADVRRAIAAYNAGEEAVTFYGGVPPYRETETYVSRIMAVLRQPKLMLH